MAITPRTGSNQTQHLGVIGTSAAAIDQDFTFSNLAVGDVLVLFHWRNNSTGTYSSLALQSGPLGATLPTFTNRLLATPGGGAPSVRIDVSDPITVSGATTDYVIRVHYASGGSVNSSNAISWLVLQGVAAAGSNWFTGDAGNQALTTNATPVTLTGAATASGHGAAYVIAALGLGGRELPFTPGSPTGGGAWVQLSQASGDHAISGANDSGIYVQTETVGAGATFDNLTLAPVGGTQRFFWIALRAAPATGVAVLNLGGITIGAAGHGPTHGTALVDLGGITVAAAGNPTGANQTEFITRRIGGGSKLGTNDLLRGFQPAAAVAALNLGGIAIAATGVRTGTVHGTASVTPGGITIGAVGTRGIHGTALVDLGGLTVAATGLRTGNGFGSAALDLGGITVAATGQRSLPGTALLNLGGPTIHASGQRTGGGSAALDLGGITIDGVGQSFGGGHGLAHLVLGGITIAGTGARLTHGSAALTLGMTISAVGGRRTIGSGLVDLGGVTVNAFGGVQPFVPASAALLLGGIRIHATGHSPANAIAADGCSWDVTWADVAASLCDAPTGLTATQEETAVARAVAVVESLTGHFYGVCTSTASPCLRCRCSDAPWCGCWFYDRIDLDPGGGVDPVARVLVVNIDGVPLGDDEFLVENRRWLVRIPQGERWPVCADPYTTPPGMAITWTHGIPPTADLLLNAVYPLAVEYANECLGQACGIDKRNVQTLQREGVTIAMVQKQDPSSGMTGLASVDEAIARDPHFTGRPGADSGWSDPMLLVPDRWSSRG